MMQSRLSGHVNVTERNLRQIDVGLVWSLLELHWPGSASCFPALETDTAQVSSPGTRRSDTRCRCGSIDGTLADMTSLGECDAN